MATALGSSGDRPSALAELMGIVSSGGLRYPSARIESMHFAKQTPFETKMVLQPQAAEIVMREEVAITIRDALTQVVQGGTAVRIRDVFKSKAGKSLKVGGKTGTGDNRYQVFSQPGKIVESRVMSRTATFVFYIGDKFFGTITAFVPSKAAANYSFTSALPVQILRILAPTLTPLIQASEPSE